MLSIIPVASAQPILSQQWGQSECSLFFLLLYCSNEKTCAYVLTLWHFFCCHLFIFFFFVLVVWWDGNSVENIVFYRQPGELFRDLNLTLHLDQLRVGQNRLRLVERKSVQPTFRFWNVTSLLVFQKLKKSGGYLECQNGKCVYAPKWVECSDRREPESLNVRWMTINWQYSSQYMLRCFHFKPNVFLFFSINLVITPDDTELFACKHWWVKGKEKGSGGKSIFTFNCPECLEWFYSLHQIAVFIYKIYFFFFLFKSVYFWWQVFEFSLRLGFTQDERSYCPWFSGLTGGTGL